MKKIAILAVIVLLAGCRPFYSEETDGRAIALAHRLVSIDAKKLPVLKPYSESGVEDLVYFSPGLSGKLASLNNDFKKGYAIELIRGDKFGGDDWLVKPSPNKHDRLLGLFDYGGVTHSLIYSSQGKNVLGLRLRFDKGRNKFHVVGYWSIDGMSPTG